MQFVPTKTQTWNPSFACTLVHGELVNLEFKLCSSLSDTQLSCDIFTYICFAKEDYL